MALLFVRQLLRGSGVSGTVDATYQPAWLTDGNPGTPVQRTGNVDLDVTPPASAQFDTFALVNHTVGVNAVLSGSITGTILPGALEEDNIRLNPFVRLVAPVTTGATFNLDVTGNSVPNLIGELWGGLAVELTDFLAGRSLDMGEPFEWEGEFASISPYEVGVSDPRRLAGDVIYTDALWAQLKSLYRAQFRGARPLLIIPDSTVNDAWCALFKFKEVHKERLHFISLEIIELQRTRW